MNDQQWETLLAVINGEMIRPLPTGFIIDSPWLPNWAGCSILDYFTSERIWFDTNIKAIDTFPQTLFLPGFWGEYGMCTEPSAFGAVCTFEEDEFPFAKKLLRSAEDVDRLEQPNPKKDGLLPFVIKRLEHLRPEIEKAGHKIRFAVARGPLNIASFLMGGTEFLMASDNKITLLGNLPPRDVLAKATPEAVQEATRSMFDDIEDRSRVILSCGGGMPPGVTTGNINAFIDAVENLTA